LASFIFFFGGIEGGFMSISEDLIKIRMFKLGISREQLAAFSGLRPQILFPGLKGTRILTAQELLRIDKSLGGLERLVEVLKPFPICLSDTRKVKFLLEKLELRDVERAFTPYLGILAEEWLIQDRQGVGR
jgi:hypothetical protein